MNYQTLRSGATAAGQSEAFAVDTRQAITVQTQGFSAGETATLQLSTDASGSAWQDALDDTDNTIVMSDTKTTLLIVGPGLYSFSVSATTAAAIIVAIS